MSTARILDRGYRSYRGERTGVRGAMRTVVRNSVERAMGWRRSGWAKVLPVASVAIAYVPAIVFVGIVSLVPDAERATVELPTYGEYYGYIQSAVALFVAFVAPEVLCTDRRTGMLGIYLASPLDRDTYLLGKAGAIALVLALVTVGPPLFMLVAFVIQGQGPDGPVEVLQTIGRILGAGALITAMYTAVSMAFSSITDRKSFATAGLILALLVTLSLSGILVETLDAPEGIVALDLIRLPLALAEKVHGESSTFADVPTTAVYVGVVVWSLLGALVARTRYQLLQVTR